MAAELSSSSQRTTAPAQRIAQRALWQAKRRAWGNALLLGVGPVGFVGALCVELLSNPWPSAALVLLLVLTAEWLYYCARQYDQAWLIRRLDRECPALEDSSELVLGCGRSDANRSAPHSALRSLQVQRIAARMETMTWPDLRTPWAWRAGLMNAVVALTVWLLSGAALRMAAEQQSAAAMRGDTNSHVDSAQATASGAEATKVSLLTSATVKIVPPAYTGLPNQTVNAVMNPQGQLNLPDLRVPYGSQVQWDLELLNAPTEAVLHFEGGNDVSLHADGQHWQAQLRAEQSSLVQLRLKDQTNLPYSRMEVLADLPPQISVIEPEKTLNERGPEQKTWVLRFVAQDDYGLGDAELSVSRTQGEGENIKVQTQTVKLQGEGDKLKRTYRYEVDLAALKLEASDDVMVHLSVTDTRQPQANHATSANVILRAAAPPPKLGSGVEGIVGGAQPAYFRSERQLIIDTENLLATKASLSADQFASRSDELGVDQKLLRLRYGQFLGEEFEGDAEHAPKGGKVPEAIAQASAEHEAATSQRAGNDAATVQAEFGHMHDQPEAATLLDPETKRILRSAIDAMWQAEGQLRSVHPDAALPFEHQALEAIKQVQQASRIYLARSGLKLPEVDLERRLTGKRDGLKDRQGTGEENSTDDALIRQLWAQLDDRQAQGPDLAQLEQLQQWLSQHPTGDQNGPHEASLNKGDLSLQAALLQARTEVQASGSCQMQCRQQLQAALWPLLATPAAAVQARIARPEETSPAADAEAAYQQEIDQLAQHQPGRVGP